MKLLLILLSALLITAGVTLLALNNPGYVMLGFGTTSLEMPLIDFLVLLALVFVALYFIIRFISMLRRTPRAIRGLRENKQASKLQKGLSQGLLEMAEGNWSRAEKQLVNCADQSESGMLNYLAAAHSAQRLNDHDRRDEYLRQASQLNPKAKVAVGLTQAELQLRAEQYEEALATLRQLEEISPKHPQVQKQLARLQHQLGEWEGLGELLPLLGKNPMVSEAEFKQLEADMAIALMQQHADKKAYTELEAVWEGLSRTARAQPRVIATYGELLIARGASDRVEPVLRKALNAQWSNTLAAVYGQLQLSQPNAALKQAEKWLQEHPDSAELLMATAHLSAEARLWGQARSLYQESLNLKPQPRTYAYLAELLEAMGEPEAAKSAYQTGLSLAVKTA